MPNVNTLSRAAQFQLREAADDLAPAEDFLDLLKGPRHIPCTWTWEGEQACAEQLDACATIHRIEPPRVCRRPQLLRGWGYGHEEDDEQIIG